MTEVKTLSKKKVSPVSQEVDLKSLSLVTIAKELNCIPPSSESARKEQLLKEIGKRKITSQNLLEWFKAFRIGGVKNKFCDLRSFQIAILKKLVKFEPTCIFRKKIPLLDDYVKEINLKK